MYLWKVHPPRQVHPPGQLHPPGRYTPWQVPPASTPPGQVHPLGRYTPWAGTPPGKVHPKAGTKHVRSLGRYTPWQVHPPGRYTPRSSACWEIRATSGRYASYWNAFLFLVFIYCSKEKYKVQIFRFSFVTMNARY